MAEVTAIAFLLNFISEIPLWITAGYNFSYMFGLYIKGGFKLSVITDKYQFIFVIFIILASVFFILDNIDYLVLN